MLRPAALTAFALDPALLRRITPARVLGAVAALVTLLVVLAIHGNLLSPAMAAQAVFGDLDVPPDTMVPMPFERAGESFPGSAYYYLAADAPGTAPPPADAPLDPGAHWDGDSAAPAADAPAATLAGPGPVARAIAVTGGDNARATECLTTAIYYEAATEPDAGQRAVAQVILNRLAHPSYPKTVCGVVYQGSERATGCQFTFTCDGSMLRRKPMRFFWDRAQAVARAALGGFVYAPVGLATHYHTFAVHPYWDASLDFIGQIGAHRFYRMEGPAGAESTFRFAYAGGEPLPGPHPRQFLAHADLRDTAADTSADPLAVERAFAAGGHAASAAVAPPAAPDPAPAYTGEMLRRGGDAAFRASNLPGTRADARQEARPEARNIQPGYEGSGTWINQPE